MNSAESRDELKRVEEILEALNDQFKLASATDGDLSQLERLTQLYRVTANICLDNSKRRVGAAIILSSDSWFPRCE